MVVIKKKELIDLPTGRISKEEAYEIVKTQSLLDVDEYEDYVHLNAYSENDMW